MGHKIEAKGHMWRGQTTLIDTGNPRNTELCGAESAFAFAYIKHMRCADHLATEPCNRTLPNSRPQELPLTLLKGNTDMSSTLCAGFGMGGLLARTLPPSIAATAVDSALVPIPGSDAHWMLEAFLTAMNSVGITAPNPAVGCVIVRDGHLLARGATQAFGGKHAERMAFEALAHTPEMLKGATAYVTLEPCAHTGRQPPCADLFPGSGITRVVVGVGDPDPRVNGQGLHRVRAAGIKVDMGPLSSEIRAWLFPFLAANHLGRPIFVGKWAQSLDGCLADDNDVSQWISGPTARAYTHWLRQKYDAILVGAGTVLADFPRLDVRDCALPQARMPLKMIFDPSGRLLNPELTLDVRAKLLKTTFLGPTDGSSLLGSTTSPAPIAAPAAPCVLLVSRQALQASQGSTWMDELIAQNNSILIVAHDAGLLPHEACLEAFANPQVLALHGRPFQSVLVEGGAQVLSLFEGAGYLDLAHVFIAPIMVGGDKNRIRPGTLAGSSAKRSSLALNQVARHRLVAHARMGNDILMEYVPENRFGTLFP